MVLRGMAIDIEVVIDGYDAWKMVSDLVYVHLEDILAHLQAKRHVEEPVLPFLVLKMVRYELFLSRCMLQKLSLFPAFRMLWFY